MIVCDGKKMIRNGNLPVDSVAVNDDWEAFLSSGLAEALHENEDYRGLCVVQTSVMANHNVVEQDVDVGDLSRVERRHDGVRVGDLVALGRDQLED